MVKITLHGQSRSEMQFLSASGDAMSITGDAQQVQFAGNTEKLLTIARDGDGGDGSHPSRSIPGLSLAFAAPDGDGKVVQSVFGSKWSGAPDYSISREGPTSTDARAQFALTVLKREANGDPMLDENGQQVTSVEYTARTSSSHCSCQTMDSALPVGTVTQVNTPLAPALEMPLGKSVKIETWDLMAGAMGDDAATISTTPSSEHIGLLQEQVEGVHRLAGPVSLKGVQPGDVVVVDLVDIQPASGRPGIQLVWPSFGFGNLATTPSGKPYISATQAFGYDIDVAKREAQLYVQGVAKQTFSLQAPFLGTMLMAPSADQVLSINKTSADDPLFLGNDFAKGGIQPSDDGYDERDVHTLAPRNATCGNLDNNDCVAGTRCYMAANVEGGGFSCGDAHLRQSEGEVSVTAIEGAVDATIGFEAMRHVRKPQAMEYENKHVYGLTAHAKTATLAVQMVTAFAVDFLTYYYSFDGGAAEAYTLLSLIADIGTCQVVDGHYTGVCKFDKAELQKLHRVPGIKNYVELLDTASSQNADGVFVASGATASRPYQNLAGFGDGTGYVVANVE